jgi:L-serine dehydratase
MGLFGGLLGWEATDPRLVSSSEAIQSAGIRVEIRITEFQAFHPNTYRISLRGGGRQHRMTAVSTGGGIVRIDEIDGVPLSMTGDNFETLAFVEGGGTGAPDGEEGADAPDGGLTSIRDRIPRLAEELEAEVVLLHESESRSILEIRTRTKPSTGALRELLCGYPVTEVRTLAPVLPIQSRQGVRVPFLSAGEMKVFCQESDEGPGDSGSGSEAWPLWRLAARYEMARGGISEQEVLERMEEIVRIMEASVEEGLAGTHYEDRILPEQTGAFRGALEAGHLLDAGILNRMILYVSAIMEVKSSMGVVVAAPTAGSAGGLPGAVLGAGHARGHGTEDMAKALLAAGLVGVFVTAVSTFAAEECGCQAECGAGSGMAAAALVTLAGGSTDEALAAASMALQNTLGMVCDPVANRVEVPCLGRNVLAASNALASANLALAGFDPVIPLDEVIPTMDEVGKALPRELRCTALGGLSMTATSRRIQERLEGKRA